MMFSFRRLFAAFFLLVMVTNGWMEVVGAAGACYLIERARAAAEEPAAETAGCSGGVCSTSARCKCCGDSCRAGADCRCGRPREQAPRGVNVHAAPCHAPPGSRLIPANMPASIAFQFLAPRDVEVFWGSTELLANTIPVYTGALIEPVYTPLSPPPRTA